MNHLYLDYNIYDEEVLTKMVIYQNQTFDFKELLSSKTTSWGCAVTVITPTQIASYPFASEQDEEDPDFLQHAAITDLLLSRLYPSYKRTYKRGDQTIYEREQKNNIFILTIPSSLAIFIQQNGKINQYQYDKLCKIIKDVKESEYATKINSNGRTQFNDFFIGDNIVTKEKIDKIMSKLKSHIVVNLGSSPQYNLNGLDFSGCTTEDDIMAKAEEYAKTYFDKTNIIHYDSHSNPQFDPHSDVEL